MTQTAKQTRQIARALIKRQVNLYGDKPWYRMSENEAMTLLGHIAQNPITAAERSVAEWYKTRNRNQERTFEREWKDATVEESMYQTLQSA